MMQEAAKIKPFVRFVDIDGIVDHHFLNFLFIKH
jgi:hypothetical protein